MADDFTRLFCQRVGCTRPSAYGVVFRYKREAAFFDYHGTCASTLGVCAECRPFFVEKILPQLIAEDPAFAGLQDVTFELVELAPQA